MTSVSLFELNEYITRVVALNFQEPVWVSCELSKVSASRGNYYLDLIEKHEDTDAITAQSNGVLWLKQSYFLKKKLGKLFDDILTDGNEVKLKVEIQHHERYGLKLNVLDIDAAYTFGQVEINRQKIIEQLQEKNLLYKNEQIELPVVLDRIAVISSPTAAGYQDFHAQLKQNKYNYQYHHDLFPAAMQGMNTESEVVAALQSIKLKTDNYDAVVIIRGGGSKLDLAAFDNYLISEEIANFNLPVIVGIGHDIDQTITDLVSHTSLKTPTAVADFLIDHNMQFESEIIDLELLIKEHILNTIQEQDSFLKEASKFIEHTVLNNIARSIERLTLVEQHLEQSVQDYLTKKKEHMVTAEMIISMNDPVNVLKRGFSLTKSNGKIIKDWTGIKKDAIIETQLADGSKFSKLQ